MRKIPIISKNACYYYYFRSRFLHTVLISNRINILFTICNHTQYLYILWSPQQQFLCWLFDCSWWPQYFFSLRTAVVFLKSSYSRTHPSLSLSLRPEFSIRMLVYLIVLILYLRSIFFFAPIATIRLHVTLWQHLVVQMCFIWKSFIFILLCKRWTGNNWN